MTSETRPPVKFEKPPVVEVVASVAFQVARPLKTVDFGEYWQSIKDEFPNVEEAPPVQLIVEGSGAGVQFNLEMAEMPPLRRVWFASSDGQRLIQLQEDRFLFNWKLVSSENKYPSFAVIFPEFRKRFEELKKYLKSTGREDLNILQLELTYVNLIPTDESSKISMGMVLEDHKMSQGDRFLPEPAAFQWNTSYVMPNNEGKLHFSARKVQSQQDATKIAIRLDFTARGMPQDHSELGLDNWFSMAHEWITQGFADSTSKDIQKTIWKRVS